MEGQSFWSFVRKGLPAGLGIIVLLWALSDCGNSRQVTDLGILQKAKPSDVIKMEGEEIFYDDGLPESQHSPWYDEPGGQLAVVFTAEDYPTFLRKVRFFVGINGIPKTTFRVRVYGGTLSGGPDESRDLLSSKVTASAPFGNRWVDVDLSDQNIIITSGDFCVAMEWLTPPGDSGRSAQFIGADYSKPDGRSWWKTGFRSKWERIAEVANVGDRDVMIRATVVKK